MSDSDSDPPTLPPDTLAILQEFYKENDLKKEKLLEAQHGTTHVEDLQLNEDWQLSQFWYDDRTATRLAEEAVSIAGLQGRIACLCSPTAYKKIRVLKPESCTSICFEYDERFGVYGSDFVFYDYKEPLKLPQEMKQSFDVVIADPPFLSEECLLKTAQTIRFLAKDKVVLCTGAVMEELAYRLLSVKPCIFVPTHTSGLQNKFSCYCNYDSQLLSLE
ncbi:hypothetical protein ScPMuIL_011940 [Solemya velum]